MKVYVDTCVLLDFILDTDDGKRPFGAIAFHFFYKGWNCAFELVVSDWNRSELKKYATEEEIAFLMQQFEKRHKLILVNHTKEDVEEAKKLSDHWQDTLHLIIAKKNKCDKLITRDLGLFSFSSIFDIAGPESI